MIHHLILEIVTSMQIVSEVFPSKLTSYFAINPSLTETILPPPYLFLSMQKGGN